MAGDKARAAATWIAAVMAFVVAYALFSELFHQKPPQQGNGATTTPTRPPPREGPSAGKRSLGVEVDDASLEEGLLVKNVIPESPAADVGLVPGDVILSVQGQSLARVPNAEGRRSTLLKQALDAVPLGELVSLQVKRADDDRIEELHVDVSEESTFELALSRELIGLGVTQLLAERDEGGLWPHYSPGEARRSVPVSALAAYALRRAGHEAWREAADAVLAYQQPDGGIADVGSARFPHRVYATSLALLALGDEDDYAPQRDRLRDWLLMAQVQERHGIDFYDNRYGGWSYYGDYGRFLRADVSVARHALQALDATGLPTDHPAWRRADAYLMLSSNQTRFAAPGAPGREREQSLRDGGFAFGPRMSKASGTPVENRFVVFRSYGSATADGVLSLLAVNGASHEAWSDPALPGYGDPRLVAALRWLANNYSLTGNPGFPDEQSAWVQGIYYYYLAALAEALHQAGVWRVVTLDRNAHAWAAELVRELRNRHNASASKAGAPLRFTNPTGLMHEDSSSIASALAVVALAAARDRLELGTGATLDAERPPGLVDQVPEFLPPALDSVGRGRQLFESRGCTGCHVPNGQGPDLRSLGVGATYLEAHGGHSGARTRLESYLRDPLAVSPLLAGPDYPATMPSVTTLGLEGQELEDLLSYVLSLTG